MKLNELISSLQKLEANVGNADIVVYANGGDHGSFLYPGDLLFGDALYIKNENINNLELPNCDLPNCGVDINAKDLLVLHVKYSIESDELWNEHNLFNLSSIKSDLYFPENDEEIEDDIPFDINNIKLPSKFKWLENTKVFSFKDNNITDVKDYINNL